MTRYTVVWSQQAENQLAQLWTDASNRQAVTDSANTIDRELAINPSNKGMPLSEGLRTFDITPLHALFFVDEGNRTVQVVLVRLLIPPTTAPEGNGQTSA